MPKKKFSAIHVVEIFICDLKHSLGLCLGQINGVKIGNFFIHFCVFRVRAIIPFLFGPEFLGHSKRSKTNNTGEISAETY